MNKEFNQPKSKVEFIREPARKVPVYKKVDVVVAGSQGACVNKDDVDVSELRRMYEINRGVKFIN